MLKYVVLCFLFVSVAPGETLFQAIRNNDLASLRQQLKNGADVNARGKNGATPLMHAAVFGNIESMKLLLDAGANVNAKNAFDATALLWSAGDLEKTRLLVEKGADVNARSKQGRTPLLVAAGHSNGEPVVRFLVDHGADINAMDNSKDNALLIAADSNDTGSIRFLVEKGVDVNARNLAGGSALMWAAGCGDLAAVQALVKAGADVNAMSERFGIPVKAGSIAMGKATPLILAATYGSPALIQTLLDAGAHVNAQELRGMTPLMMAVSSEYQRADVIQLLLARGADPNIKSVAGETAADWAAKFNHPDVVKLLPGARSTTAAPELGPPAEIGNALTKSLSLLQASVPGFFREGGCVGCHSQHYTALALKAARERSIPIDEKAAAEMAKTLAAEYAPQTDLLPQRLSFAGTETVSFFLMALRDINYPADGMTDAMVATLASQQRADGGWPRATPFANARPPIQDGVMALAARNVLALRNFGFPGRQAEFDERIVRARKWLIALAPRHHDEQVFRLLGLKWSGADPQIIGKVTQEVLAAQRSDGGWSQNPYLASDAYATGETLYALHEAAESAVSTLAYQRGVLYLLRSQLPDGSWHVTSRSVKFQPYFQSGFPHNHDQWISATATAWAAAALALGMPRTHLSQ